MSIHNTVGHNPDDVAWPAVWIIVLNYNRWRRTLACLESVSSLDYANFQVLVIDNASTDDSVERIRAAYPRMEVMQLEKNFGFAGGNNPGMRLALARGADYVWLLNNDAVADAGALTSLVESAGEDPGLGAVGSVIYEMDAPEQIQSWGGARLYLWSGHTRNVVSPSAKLSYLTGASLLLRRQALEEVSLFDERFFFLWEDADLSLRLRKAGWRIAVSEKSKVWHEGGGTASAISPARMQYHATGLVLMLRKHAAVPWLSALPILAYYVLLATRQFSWQSFQRALRGWWRGWWE